MCDFVFNYLLYGLYFCPERDEKYPSELLKRMAARAMHILWNSEKMYVLGKIYNKTQIRKLIVKKMTPDMLDDAIEFYLCFEENRTVHTLAHIILLTVICSKPYAEFIFNREKLKVKRCDVA